MFVAPSSRRKSAAHGVNVNLVPMLDAMVTILSFLLLTSSYIALSVIETPAPQLAPAPEQVEQMKDKPLQLTLHIQETQIILQDWSGSRVNKNIPNVNNPQTGELQYDYEGLHKALLEIKQQFPKETKLVLKPNSGVSYEALVGIIDSSRTIEKTDPPFFKKNDKGVDEPETNLFPEIIFGNLLS